jgi:5-methylcytosine-specific restriction endonuclease McrA
MDYFGYGEQDFMPCEVDNNPAVDVHHIHGRGKGKDVIENLIALCRICHNKAHNNYRTYVHPDVYQAIHNNFLKRKT